MIPPVIVPVTSREILHALKYNFVGNRSKLIEFEQEISKYNQCKHTILTYSGRTALYVLLKAYGLKKSDEVIMPSYMCETVSKLLLDMGFKINFVDIDPSTYNMDINDLNEKITKSTKVVLAVHMFGIPCDIHAIMDMAQDNNSIVIEDAAQAIGAEYKNTKVGTIGDSGFYSFGRGKPITAMGGGAIATDDDSIARKCREINSIFEQKSSDLLILIQLLGYSSLRNRTIYEILSKIVRSDEFRTNMNLDDFRHRFTDLQAIVGSIQLQMLDNFNSKRISNAEFMIRKFKKIAVKLPEISQYCKPIFLRLPIQINESIHRDRLIYLLKKVGIETSIVYPIPLPNIYNVDKVGYHGTEEVIKRVIALPTHPFINNYDIIKITNVIEKYCGGT